jgi:HEPN domain-containing protein
MDGEVEQVNREAANWLSGAQYDIETAGHMLKTGRYPYVIFMCHLTIEKTLKALVCEETNAPPPRTHDLQKLAVLGKVRLKPNLEQFLAQVTDAHIATRYPEDVAQMILQYSKTVAQEFLERTTEVIQCLRADPRLKS